jgi:hypothetical protein
VRFQDSEFFLHGSIIQRESDGIQGPPEVSWGRTEVSWGPPEVS